MSSDKLLQFIRVLAIFVMTIVYIHQGECVISSFGLNFYTITYLLVLAVFLGLLYILRFYVFLKNPPKWGDYEKVMHNIQLALLGISIILTGIEHLSNVDSDTAVIIKKLAFASFSIWFADIVFNLLVKLYRRFYDDQGGDV